VRYNFLTKAMVVLAALCFMVAAVPAPSPAAQMDELKQQIDSLSQQLQELQKRLDEAEKESNYNKEDVDMLSDRLDKAEMHTAKDKLNLGIELEPKVWSVHMDDVLMAPSSVVSGFFTDVSAGGFNGATLSQIQQGMAGMAATGIPAPEEADVNNDIVYTTKFRINMDAKVNNNLSFTGRLAAYKVWSDSAGVNVNSGLFNDYNLDGNTSSTPHGDTIHLERAYFNYKNRIGSVPYNFSLGRRPSTEGPPAMIRKNGLEGGSPHAGIINWQFDGASLNFGLEESTGMPGLAVKFCYGVGFESQWGGTGTFSSSPDVEDVHMFGIIATLYDDYTTKVEVNWAHAWDVTDGFTGLTVMPWIAYTADQDGDGTEEYYFDKNYGGYVSRVEATNNIGDWDAVSLLVKSSLFEEKLDVFADLAWSHTHATGYTEHPVYGDIFQYGLLSTGELEDHDGYMIWLGARYNIDSIGGKLGLEYNYGSQYWFPFTQAEDNLIASKIAARGHVFEPYYIQEISGYNFFLKAGAQFYDYEYTNSGNPLGEPVKISDATAFDALFPVIDKMQIYYLSAVLRF
jgi:hypothetical protein